MKNNDKIIELLSYIDIANGFSQGKPMTLDSRELYKSGISLPEQKELLDILANDYRYIKYKEAPVYKSFEDIPEEILLELYDIEEMGLQGKTDFADMIEDLLAEKTYTILALDRFSTTLHKIDMTTLPKIKPANIKEHESFVIEHLDTDNYNKNSGILTLTPYVKIDYSNAGSVRRKNGNKYKQPQLLEMLFKNVNTLKQGVSFSKILGVNDSIITGNHVKNIRNTIQEINGKITDIGGPDNLIIIQGRKVIVNQIICKVC